MNYVLHDASARCNLLVPHGTNFDVVVELRGGDVLYQAQMRSWGALDVDVSCAHNK